jgi:hypothetical protein
MHGVYPQQVGFESWNKILFIRIRGVGFIRHGHHVNAIYLYIWIVKGWAGIPTLILYFFSWQLKFIYQLSNKKRMFTESLAIFPCYFPKAVAQRIWCSKTLSAIKFFRPTAHPYCLALDAFLTIALPVYCIPVAMLEQEVAACWWQFRSAIFLQFLIPSVFNSLWRRQSVLWKGSATDTPEWQT